MHPRLVRELKTVRAMIGIYCRTHHQKTQDLCMKCRELEAYAERRLSGCPFQQNKTTCANCPVHCYNPSRREQIKKVMRFSGPKMILHHPYLAVAHLLDGRRKRVKTCDMSESPKKDSRSHRV